MLVFNRGEFLGRLFTVLKLGVALFVLFFLANKFVDLWKTNAGGEQIKEATQEMRRQ